MSAQFNTTVQHVRLPDETEISDCIESKPNRKSSKLVIHDHDPNTQTFSSLICVIIPMALLKVTNSIVNSSLSLAIPLYTISKYPSNATTIAGIIITVQGIGVTCGSPFVGRFIALTSDEFTIICTILLRTLSVAFMLIFDESLIVWIIASLFYGISLTSNSTAINHILSKSIKVNKRGRVSSLIAGVSRAGRAIGPLYTGHIANLQIPLLISTIISLCGLFVVCCTMIPPNVPINIQNISKTKTKTKTILNENEYDEYTTDNEQDDDSNDQPEPEAVLVSTGSFIYFKESWKQIGWKKLQLKSWLNYNNSNDETKNTSDSKGLCYVWINYGKLMLLYGLFGFGLRWVRQTRKVILTFQGHELNLSNGSIGTVNSVSFILDSCMFLLSGYVMDRFGRKANGISGLILFIIPLCIISFVNNFSQLLVMSILFGLGDGITTGLMMVFTADLAPKECRSEFIGSFKLFVNIPRIICPFITGFLCNDVSLFSAAILSAVIGAVSLFWITFMLEDPSKVSNRENLKESIIGNDINNSDTNDNEILVTDTAITNDHDIKMDDLGVVDVNDTIVSTSSTAQMLDEQLIPSANSSVN